MNDQNVCGVKLVASPDGTDIPIPSDGLAFNGELITIKEDAEVQIHPLSENGYYIVLNNSESSNDEAADLFTELTTEGAITTLEHLASEAFEAVSKIAIKAAGFFAGVLVSLFTSSNLTREIFIRAQLEDGTPITYCLLLDAN